MEDENLQTIAVNEEDGTSSGSAPEVQETEVQEVTQNSEGETVERAKYDNLQKALQKEREEKRRIKEYYETQTPTYEPTQTAAGEDQGYVDPDQFAAKIEQRALRKFEFIQQDKEEWNAAISENPELKDNPALASAVRAYRNERLIGGEFIGYKDAAEEVLKPFRQATSSAKDEGRREAQVSETIQRRAGLGSPGEKTTTESSEVDKLRQAMKSPDSRVAEQARLKYLSIMYPKD